MTSYIILIALHAVFFIFGCIESTEMKNVDSGRHTAMIQCSYLGNTVRGLVSCWC